MALSHNISVVQNIFLKDYVYRGYVKTDVKDRSVGPNHQQCADLRMQVTPFNKNVLKQSFFKYLPWHMNVDIKTYNIRAQSDGNTQQISAISRP